VFVWILELVKTSLSPKAVFCNGGVYIGAPGRRRPVPCAWVRASSASVNFVAGESKRLGRALLSAGVVLAASVVAAPLV
jgi:hypothetical protein